VVTHQLQVERRTAKAHRPKTNALPLDYATRIGGLGGGGSRLLAHLMACFQHGSKADPFELWTDRRTDGQQHRLMPAL